MKVCYLALPILWTLVLTKSRLMFVMDNVTEFPAPFAFKMYGRALEWGHPMGGAIVT